MSSKTSSQYNDIFCWKVIDPLTYSSMLEVGEVGCEMRKKIIFQANVCRGELCLLHQINISTIKPFSVYLYA
jgi:hypothetical protein